MPTLLNRFILGTVGLAALFLCLVGVMQPKELVILLNGLFAGSLVAIIVAYHSLIINAVLGVGEYNRVRQMTIGFALSWVVIALSAGASIYSRSADVPLAAPLTTAAIRYLAIIAAVLQVTAPDFGLGLFHGRDRRVLWAAAILGSMTAGVMIYLQDGTLLF